MSAQVPTQNVPSIKKHYDEKVVPALREELQLKNPMQLPRLEKVVINMGLGAAVQNNKLIDSAVTELETITGQKAVVTRARKSIATFKLREGMPIGVKVTLRREKMWEFVSRFVNLALPRVRDFKGISPKGFDGRGNYTVGIKEQIIFPEIEYDKVDKIKGMNVSFVTTATNNEHGKALLKHLGLPFRK